MLLYYILKREVIFSIWHVFRVSNTVLTFLLGTMYIGIIILTLQVFDEHVLWMHDSFLNEETARFCEGYHTMYHS